MTSHTTPQRLQARLAPASVLRVHLICILILGIAHIGSLAVISQLDPVEHPGFVAVCGKFLLDSELNIPTYFQSTCLLFSSLLLAIIAWSLRGSQPVQARWWAVLSILFLGLSLEETIGFHELLIIPLRERWGLQGALYFAWVVPGLIGVTVFGLAFVRFWWRLPARTRTQMVIAAGLYLAGALGMEMIGGIFAEQSGFHGTLAEQAQVNIPYLAAATIEEMLEMAGIAVWVYALLSWLKIANTRLSLEFDARIATGNRNSESSPTRSGNAQTAGSAEERESVCV